MTQTSTTHQQQHIVLNRDLIRLFKLFWVILTVATNLSYSASAQAARDSVNVPRWKVNLINKIMGAQVGYHNWSKGGSNSLSVTTKLEGKAQHESEAWLQKIDLSTAYGLLKQDTLSFRKADDLISLNYSLQNKGRGFFKTFNPTVANQFRTQFAAGYDYKRDPLKGGRVPPVKISDFLSPATVTQTIGLTYNPNQWFTQRLGIGGKETIVLIERLRPHYHGDSLYNPVKFELGMEARTLTEKELVKNVKLKSSLGLFKSFHEPDLPDMIWENDIYMKVNSWLGVNIEVDAAYDEDVSANLQIKEVLSLGVTVVLI